MAKTWAQRYEGYALRQATGIRNQIAEEVGQLKYAGDDGEKIERAEARLSSWDELLITYVKAKKAPEIRRLDALVGMNAEVRKAVGYLRAEIKGPRETLAQALEGRVTVDREDLETLLAWAEEPKKEKE